MTGDGRTDLVVSYLNPSSFESLPNGKIRMDVKARVLRSDGDGTFTAKALQTMSEWNWPTFTITSGPPPYTPQFRRGLGDVTGDGRTDLVMHYAGTYFHGVGVHVRRSDGDGTFTAIPAESPNYTGTYAWWRRELADVTGDGRADLVLHSAGSSGGIWVRTLRSDGDGTFTARALETPVASGNYSGWQRSFADVTGNGRMDLVLHSAGSSGGIKVRTLVADGDGTFTAKALETPVSSGAYGGWQRELADVTGDGRADLVLHSAGTSGGIKVRTLVADGDGTFTAKALETPASGHSGGGSASWGT